MSIVTGTLQRVTAEVCESLVEGKTGGSDPCPWECLLGIVERPPEG